MEEGPDEVVRWKDETEKGQPGCNMELHTEKGEQLQKLWKEFSGVLCDKPGRTAMVEHHIESGEAAPIQQAPYRVPHAYRDTVASELQEMEEAGIIEPSVSDWATSIVSVEKKDGTLRLCVDYRRLNSVTQVDAYPMPRIDNLIDQLGEAKFITTLDLT